MTVFVTDTQRDRQASECAGKKEMILSKWCFISVINPGSQEDEEGLSLSPATMVRNKGTLMGPIRAKYQIISEWSCPVEPEVCWTGGPSLIHLHAVHAGW